MQSTELTELLMWAGIITVLIFIAVFLWKAFKKFIVVFILVLIILVSYKLLKASGF